MMSNSKNLSRVIFTILCVFFFTAFMTTAFSYGLTPMMILAGVVSGLFFSLILFSAEYLFREGTLKVLNTLTLGLFLGCLLGQGVIIVLTSSLDIAHLVLPSQLLGLIKGAVFLFSTYFCVIFSQKSTNEVYVSIPFIKFKPAAQKKKKKDIIVDRSVLSDPRLIDLAASGLCDHYLIIPRFIIKEIYETLDSPHETNQLNTRKAIEILKRLEAMKELQPRYVETDFPELKEGNAKVVRLARLLDANILTADISQIEESAVEGIRIININTLSRALQPLTQMGEFLQIKVQHYGKEARQGVGYLDDGSMVVINGGAAFIGEKIKAQVISVKHTSSGSRRMIFCNALDEDMLQNQEAGNSMAHLGNTPDNYFAL